MGQMAEAIVYILFLIFALWLVKAFFSIIPELLKFP